MSHGISEMEGFSQIHVSTNTHTSPFSLSSSAELSISHAIMRTALSGAFWVKGSGGFRVQQEGRSLSQKIRFLYLCYGKRILTYKAWRPVKMFLKNIFSCNSLSLSSDQTETVTALKPSSSITSGAAREDWGVWKWPNYFHTCSQETWSSKMKDWEAMVLTV